MEPLSLKRARYLPVNFKEIRLTYYAITHKEAFETLAREMDRLRNAFLINDVVQREKDILEPAWATKDREVFCRNMEECGLNTALVDMRNLSLDYYNVLSNQMLLDQPFFEFFNEDDNNITWGGLVHNRHDVCVAGMWLNSCSWALMSGFGCGYGVGRSSLKIDRSISIREVCAIVASDYEAMLVKEQAREALELFRHQYLNDILAILRAQFPSHQLLLSPNRRDIVLSSDNNSVTLSIAQLLKDQ